MIRTIPLACFLAALLFVPVAFAQTDPKLRDELLAMRDRDQAARAQCTGNADELSKCFARIFEDVDKPNTKRLNEILVSRGFPTLSSVGREAVQSFAIVMQHSGDIELKKKSRKGMKRALKEKGVSVMDYTNFVDGLLVNEGKPQIYGSNFVTQDGKLVMSPAQDRKNLNARRKKIGLPPIAEYAKMLGEMYKLEVVVPNQ
jgi:hypothetical protein